MVLRTGKKGNFPRRFRTSPDPEDKGVAWNGNELALWIADQRLARSATRNINLETPPFMFRSALDYLFETKINITDLAVLF